MEKRKGNRALGLRICKGEGAESKGRAVEKGKRREG